MGSKRKNREVNSPEPFRGPTRDRLTQRRGFSYDGRRNGHRFTGLRPGGLIAMAGIVVAVVLVSFVAVRPDLSQTDASRPNSAPAQGIKLVPATTGSVESGKVTVSLDEVKAKSMLYWDYKQADGKTTPLMAYLAPSGAVKVAVRICDGNCNDLSFRIDGKEMVCDACGTKWDLESSKGISGGCLASPPEVLPSSLADGRVLVDEDKLTNWTRRSL